MIINKEKKNFSRYLLYVIILFNLLNLIDKVTTYFGLRKGFVESNQITINLITSYGIANAMILQFIMGVIVSFVIYFIIKIFQDYKYTLSTIGGFSYLSVAYFMALINNISLLWRA